MPSRHSITNKCQQGWALKNWCFRIAMMEKTLESPLDCKEIKPVNPKGNQPWIFIGWTDAEVEAPILWPPDVKTDSLEKTLMLRKMEGKKRSVQQRMRRLDGITNSMEMTLGKLGRQWRTGKPGVLQSMGSQRVRHDLATEQQQQQTPATMPGA